MASLKVEDRTDNKVLELMAYGLKGITCWNILIGLIVASIYGKDVDKVFRIYIDESSQKLNFLTEISFMMLMIAQNPYTFYALKEPILVMIDEISSQSIRKQLQMASIKNSHK